MTTSPGPRTHLPTHWPTRRPTRRPTRTAIAAAAAAVIATAVTTGPAAAASTDHGLHVRALTDHVVRPTATPVTDATGSLVFIRGYNVWISRVDGSGARQLTTDGSFANQYHSPSQADDGTIAVAHTGLIDELTPAGTLLRTLDPPALPNDLAQPMDGTPANVAISPDATLVAYTFALFDCPVAAPCETRYATGYTAADRVTDPAAYGITEFDSPSWIGDHRTVQGGGYLAEINLQEVGAAPFHWFRMSEMVPGRFDDLSDPAVSRDGRYVATVMGYGSNRAILWSSVPGDVLHGTGGIPQPLCLTNTGDLADPAWSADGSRLAWSYQGDLWTTTDPGACTQPTVVLTGATEPAFSAAPFAANPPTGAPGAPGAPGGATAPGGTGGTTGAHAGSGPDAAPMRCTARPRVTGTPRAGHRLHAGRGSWTSPVTTVGYQWLRDGRPIRGARHATYVVTPHDRGARISVRVTARHGSTHASATSRPVRVG